MTDYFAAISDTLEDFLAQPTVQEPSRVNRAPADFVPALERSFTEPCQRCRGTGRFGRFGSCFACKGTGRKTFKTAPEQRAKRRVQAAVAKVEAMAAWADQYKTEVTWLRHEAERYHTGRSSFDFPAKLLESLERYGNLTDGQLAAVRKLIAKGEQRQQVAQQRVQEAKEITVEKIEQAFASAKEARLKWPKLRLDTFQFSPAGAASANAGAIYVKEGETYLGKIVNSRFICSRDCEPGTRDRVIAAAADPAAAAKAYGLRTGQCGCCGRELTDPESIEAGIGPICAKKYGW